MKPITWCSSNSPTRHQILSNANRIKTIRITTLTLKFANGIINPETAGREAKILPFASRTSYQPVPEKEAQISPHTSFAADPTYPAPAELRMGRQRGSGIRSWIGRSEHGCVTSGRDRVTFAGALLQQKRQPEQSRVAWWLLGGQRRMVYLDTPCPVFHSLCSTAVQLNCLIN
jgi:hypothetical protein